MEWCCFTLPEDLPERSPDLLSSYAAPFTGMTSWWTRGQWWLRKPWAVLVGLLIKTSVVLLLVLGSLLMESLKGEKTTAQQKLGSKWPRLNLEMRAAAFWLLFQSTGGKELCPCPGALFHFEPHHLWKNSQLPHMPLLEPQLCFHRWAQWDRSDT